MNLTSNILGLSQTSSDVTLQSVPTTASGIVPEQHLVFQNGQLWNPDLKKYLSVNTQLVKADLNDARGATGWTIGKLWSTGHWSRQSLTVKLINFNQMDLRSGWLSLKRCLSTDQLILSNCTWMCRKLFLSVIVPNCYFKVYMVRYLKLKSVVVAWGLNWKPQMLRINELHSENVQLSNSRCAEPAATVEPGQAAPVQVDSIRRHSVQLRQVVGLQGRPVSDLRLQEQPGAGEAGNCLQPEE